MKSTSENLLNEYADYFGRKTGLKVRVFEDGGDILCSGFFFCILSDEEIVKSGGPFIGATELFDALQGAVHELANQPLSTAAA